MVNVDHNPKRWLVGEILMAWMTEVFEDSISWKPSMDKEDRCKEVKCYFFFGCFECVFS
jgi:hypothetical protein